MAEDKGSEVSETISKAVPAVTGGVSGAIGGPLVGAAGSVVGGLISNLFNKGQQAKAENFQRELAQHGISWRVADAKAAGIHPLFAMGAQIPMANPMVLGDSLGTSIAQAGQNVGGAIAGSQTEAEKMAAWAAYRVATSTAERNEAEAGYFNGMTAKLTQEQTSSPLGVTQEGKGQMMAGQTPNVPGDPHGAPDTGWINKKAVDQPSVRAGMPHVQSGLYAGWQEVQLEPGLPALMPGLEGESWMEHWNEMSIREQIALAKRGSYVYGPSYARDFLDYMWKGTPPSNYYKALRDRPAYERSHKGPGAGFKDWFRSDYQPWYNKKK